MPVSITPTTTLLAEGLARLQASTNFTSSPAVPVVPMIAWPVFCSPHMLAKRVSFGTAFTQRR